MVKKERQKYKSRKKQLGRRENREEATLAMLARFQKKLSTARMLAGDYDDIEEEKTVVEEEDDDDDMSWWVFLWVCLCLPRYNHSGWLGVKHQVTTTVCLCLNVSVYKWISMLCVCVKINQRSFQPFLCLGVLCVRDKINKHSFGHTVCPW